ncbi:MAG: lipase family protein [Bacteroidota bacterium]
MNFQNLNKTEFLPLLMTLIVTLFGACNNEDVMITTNPPSTERGYLVSYSKTGSMTTDEVDSAGAEEGDVSAYTNHDLDIYSIVYNSLDDGNLLEVSGLVFIPKNVSGLLDLLQNHHGTIIPGDDGAVPSTYTGGMKGSSEMYFVGATMASNGYVVSMPDYVGYGSTADREHPYTIHHELAEVSVDMLRATRQLLTTLSIGFSDEVFLMGWSEGGGAGLATHQYLQEKYSDEFVIKGSSLFAGPYDYFTFVKDIMTNRNQEDEELSIYSWALYATNNYNSTLNRDPSSVWSYTVSNQIDALDVPSLKPADILHADYMDRTVNETDIEWVTALKENSLLEGWVPQGHLFFHSGTADLIVPHYNSVNAHQYFESINVNSTLYEYPGEDHYTPLYDYVTTTLNDFENL